MRQAIVAALAAAIGGGLGAVARADDAAGAAEPACSEIDWASGQYDDATMIRLCEVSDRLAAIPSDDWVERVARAIGQAGCPRGWPEDPFALEAHEARAKGHLLGALGLAPDEAAFFARDVEGVFLDAQEVLAEQGRLVSVTDYEDELIPRACAGG